MDYINVIQSGVVGNVAYDFLKYGIPLAFDSFKSGLKSKGQEWLLDEQVTEKLLARATELYQPDQNLEKYNQVIQQDAVLAELIKAIAKPSNKNTQTLNGCAQSTAIGGNVAELIINYSTPPAFGDSSIKKD